jgi:hypothetical protein
MRFLFEFLFEFLFLLLSGVIALEGAASSWTVPGPPLLTLEAADAMASAW